MFSKEAFGNRLLELQSGKINVSLEYLVGRDEIPNRKELPYEQ